MYRVASGNSRCRLLGRSAGADTIDISQFSALAQFDFYMQVQQHYTTHNTSATIELREPEVEPLATAIYTAIQQDQGYISAALLARFDAHETFPRLPFEPISKERYEQEVTAVARRKRSMISMKPSPAIPNPSWKQDLRAATPISV